MDRLESLLGNRRIFGSQCEFGSNLVPRPFYDMIFGSEIRKTDEYKLIIGRNLK